MKSTEIAIVVVLSEGRVLVRRRPGSGPLAGLWEFPGGKLQPGETVTDALLRELEEETGLQPQSTPKPLLSFEHHYPDRSLRLHFFTCIYTAPPDLEEWNWVDLDQLAQLPMPEANQEALRKLSLQSGSRSAETE